MVGKKKEKKKKTQVLRESHAKAEPKKKFYVSLCFFFVVVVLFLLFLFHWGLFSLSCPLDKPRVGVDVGVDQRIHEELTALTGRRHAQVTALQSGAESSHAAATADFTVVARPHRVANLVRRT